MSPQPGVRPPGIDLYWLPLGAGGHSVKWNGRVFEVVDATLHRRTRCALYHSALVIRQGPARFVIEQGPAGPRGGADRGVVVVGPVGLRTAGRVRLFRYEVRCWPEGEIPDVDEAVDSPRVLTTDPDTARRALAAVARVPPHTWGRDESRAGEMWNSNSVVAWVLTQAGLDAAAVCPPAGGRAPGWRAGVVVAERNRFSGT